MEIHKNTVATISFYLPTSDTSVSSATYVVNGGTSPTALVVTTASGIATAKLPYFGSEVEVTVTWNFTVPGSGGYSQVDKYQIVTPYLSIRQVKEIVPTASDVEAFDAEAAVRHIINAHTGQSFGYVVGDKAAVGNGDNGLALPSRLIRLTSFGLTGADTKLYDIANYPVGYPTYFLGNGVYDIVGDGWYIKTLSGNPDLGIKADVSEGIYTGGIIYNPFSVRGRGFADDARFTITGEWGYLEVPRAIVEAAKLLVSDYSCADASYRDRFLTSLTSPDWRIQFHSGAFRDTGNVRANQLLSDYVLKRGWAVI